MRGWVVLAAIAAMGCSSRREAELSSTAAPHALSAFPAFGRALAAATPLARVRGGFETRFEGHGGVSVRPTGALRVTFPDRADGATHIAAFVDPLLFVEVRPLNLAPATAHVEGNLLRMRDGQTGVEQILFASLDRAEEVRVLPKAESCELAWELKKGPHVGALRVVGDTLEVVDREGTPRLRTEPMFAVDAAGTRRALAPRLTGSTLRVQLDARGLVAPIAVDPAWTASAGSMPYPSQQASAATLAGGKILTSGGYTTSGETVNSAVYDPATDSWKSVGTMKAARREHLLVTLPSGKVLAVASWLNVSTAEIYDPATETWSYVKSLTYTRSGPSGVLLPSGKIFVPGSSTGTSSTSNPSEIYDPATDTWQAVRPPFTDRSNGLGAVTATGKLAFVNNDRVELYDPATNTWTLGPKASFDHTGEGYASSGGYLYAFGGTASTKVAEIERFDPATLSWAHLGRMPSTPSNRVQVVPLSSGKLFAITGSGSTSTAASLFDPGTGLALAAGTFTVARASGTAVRLPGDKVLVFGGSESGGYLRLSTSYQRETPYGASCQAMELI